MQDLEVGTRSSTQKAPGIHKHDLKVEIQAPGKHIP